MKKTIQFIISLAVFVLIVLPVFSFSAGLVPCGGTGQPACDFTQFMNLINKVIKFIIVALAVPISAVMFFYAGFLMVTSAGSAESKTKAKNVFSNTLFGLAIAVASWLIVRTILFILGYKGDWIGFY